MGLIGLGVLFFIMIACLCGIGKAWERNIRDKYPEQIGRGK